MELNVFEKFALQQLIEREQAEARVLGNEQAKRFNEFVTLVSQEHNVPMEFLRYDGQTQTFSDARVTAPEGAGEIPPLPRKARRKSNGTKDHEANEHEGIETDVGDIAPVA